MHRKSLVIKGMGVPRISIWTRGFLDSHVFKAAVLNPETGYICSGYIIGKCKLFNEFSFKRMKQLELELKAVRSEAAALMTKEAQIRKNLEEDVAKTTLESINEKREAIRCANRRAAYIKEHEENIKRLVEIDSKIRSSEISAKEELDALASALQSRFTTYAYGMTLHHVQNSFIPPIETDSCFEFYRGSHKEEDDQLRCMIKEVFHYD